MSFFISEVGGNNLNDSSYSKTIGSVSTNLSATTLSDRAFKKDASFLSSNQSDSKIKLEESILIDNYTEESDPVYVKLKFDSKEFAKEMQSDSNNINNKEFKLLNELFSQELNSGKSHIFIKIIIFFV